MLEIRRLTDETIPLLWTMEDRRLDTERAVVRAKQGGFVLEYKPLPAALWRVGGSERDIPGEARDWIGRDDRAVFLAWLDGALAGQMLIELWEDGLARVRDIRVAMTVRKRGVGTALLALGEDWAREKGRGGLVAVTRDVNAGACQFFTRVGFALGGVDQLRYLAGNRAAQRAAGLRETALIFYRFIK